MKDLKEILKIYREVYLEKPYFENWKEKALTDKLTKMLLEMNAYVAEIDNIIVGFIFIDTYLWSDGIRGYMEDFGVSKQFRNMGVGDALMKQAEKYLKIQKIKKVMLDANLDSEAFNFYIKRGFNKTRYIKLEKNLK